ncbi:MAG: type II toxin-antitoxin system RelE/ParE family toxin [Acidobacteria bacterium]|nr:type II toxin-antitoxin system RelE/ParE family toxin [Acidobacteriota bacterium]
MALSIKVVRSAARQIAEASEWWQANRPAVPEALAEELRRGLALIAQQPGIGAQARNAKLEGVRRLCLSRVRYYLYYRVRRPSEVVEVLAFWHASRGSGPNV